MHRYFAQLTTDNDMSFTAHSAIVSFLAAAHKTMLEWLQEAQQKNGFNGDALRRWWHDIMERRVERERRREFFSEVLRKANIVSHWFLTFQSSIYCYQMRSKLAVHNESPRRPKENNASKVYDIVAKSRSIYEDEARGAVDALMSFLTKLDHGPSPICVT